MYIYIYIFIYIYIYICVIYYIYICTYSKYLFHSIKILFISRFLKLSETLLTYRSSSEKKIFLYNTPRAKA